MKLTDLTRIVNGILLGTEKEFSAVSTDTRTLVAGQVFIALRGEQFDGHDFVDLAFEKGAVAVVVDTRFSIEKSFPPLIQVEDTLKAYGQFASHCAQQFDSKRVAITGSCGKTTVKQMLKAILSEAGNVLATKGNLNNEIGVPLTLLEINAGHDFAVIEMGANHAGEIAYLSSLVKPKVVSILNADRAHLEGFGSIDGVANAKGEIFSGADKNGTAVLNLDEKYFSLWESLCQENELRLVTTSLTNVEADILLLESNLSNENSEIKVKVFEEAFSFIVPFPGEHNIKNAMIAIGIAAVLGLSLKDIASGLAKAVPEKGRLKILTISGHTVIDDTYNANPLSVKAAIDVLSLYANKKILILGDMAELGEQSASLHKDVGLYARQKNLDVLLTCGTLTEETFKAFAGDGKAYSQQTDLIKELPVWMQTYPQSVFLVKGSRSAAMENVVNAFVALGEAA